jgi:hypothetical protein
MKNVKLRQMMTAAVMAITVLFASCNQEDENLEVATDAISPEVISQFKDLGFDVSDIEKRDGFNPLSGEKTGLEYVLEGDIVITENNLKAMLDSEVFHEGPNGEQYRTNNLVCGPRTINVIGYTGGGNALDSKMRTALQWAIDNYNALNINLNFTLTFGTNYGPYDIVVYRVSGGGGGSAGFPSNCNPYKFVQIQSGTSNYSTNVVEHVITHEIGHSVGFRHTDWFNRSYSCGSGGSEGTAGVGAVHIPGTTTGIDPNSIMLSCFSSSEDGEFSSQDITALEYLY